MADAENNHTKWLKSRKGRKFANRCKELVLRFNSPCVMPEHILLAIWDSMDIQIMFTLNESLHGKARENLELFLEELTDESSNDTRMTNTPFTTRYWEKVDELVNELDMDYSNLSEAVFLLALLYEEDSFQQYLLLSLGFTAEKLFKALKEDEPFLLTEDDAPVDGKLFSDDDSDDDASDNAEDDLDEDFWKRARGRKLRLPNEQAMENTQASDNKSSSGIPELLRP